VLRLLTDTTIPPTSNQAERDLRPSKTQQKTSGRLRSEKTTRDRYAIRGYASTAVKHRIAVLTAIRDALAGTPGYHPSQKPPELAQKQSPTQLTGNSSQDLNVYRPSPSARWPV